MLQTKGPSHRSFRTSLVVLAVALLAASLSACVYPPGLVPGGSPPNGAPVLPRIPRQTMAVNDQFVLSFEVEDESPATLIVAVRTSNLNLVPNASIALTVESPGHYRLVITPVRDLTGDAVVTITARDQRGLTGETSFVLTVQ